MAQLPLINKLKPQKHLTTRPYTRSMDNKQQWRDSESIEQGCSSDEDEKSELVKSMRRLKVIGTGRRTIAEEWEKVITKLSEARKQKDNRRQSDQC